MNQEVITSPCHSLSRFICGVFPNVFLGNYFWSKQVANAIHLFGTVYVEYALVCFGLFMKSPLAKLPKIWDWAILTPHLFPNGRCNLSLTECQKKRRVSTFFFLGQGLNIYPLHLLYGIYLPTFTMKIN